METFSNIVDGKAAAAADGRTLDIVDPSTGEVYATSPLSGPDDVDTAFRSARTAYRGDWGRDHAVGRMNALLAIADSVQEHAEELVEIEHRDTGKPKGLTMSEEIGPMVDQFRFFAGRRAAPAGRRPRSTWPGTSRTCAASRWASSAR